MFQISVILGTDLGWRSPQTQERGSSAGCQLVPNDPRAWKRPLIKSVRPHQERLPAALTRIQSPRLAVGMEVDVSKSFGVARSWLAVRRLLAGINRVVMGTVHQGKLSRYLLGRKLHQKEEHASPAVTLPRAGQKSTLCHPPSQVQEGRI